MTPKPLTLGVLPGDGIGPEIVAAAVAVTEAALAARKIAVHWKRLAIGYEAIQTAGVPLPPDTLTALDGLDAWLLGPHDNAGYPRRFRGELSPGGAIRKRYNLFANIRPARALPGVPALCPGMDLVIVRENTEGFYADRNMYDGAGEFMPTPDVALAVGVFTRQACERIARVAFRLAQGRRRSVTIAHKTNVLAKTTGLFRDACLQIARDHPEVSVRSEHIDALAALLVRDPDQFDVVVTENMFGDILSDLTGQLCGSLGMAPSLNTAEGKAMAQAAHGAAPDIAGRNVANPVAMIASSAMLLRWLGDHLQRPELGLAAAEIDDAVRGTLIAGVLTPDLGGRASTTDFSDAVVARLRAG